MHRYILLLIVLVGCGSKEQNMVKLDLMEKGIPIEIMAPLNAKVVVDDLGIMKDVTIQDSLGFDVQIFISETNSFNAKKIKDEQKELVEAAPFFSKIMEESDNGFIFEKKIDENLLRYDFRYIHIQGDEKYVFQTGLSGGHSEANVRAMYQAVQKK